MPVAVRMEEIVKTFPGVVANNGITLEVLQGEIHALLGENGSGKTTLMNILYGLCRPDSGRILLFCDLTQIHSPREAIAQGVGMIHQHFMLIPTLSVLDNIIMGRKSTREPFLDIIKAEQEIQGILQTCGFSIPLKAKLWQLGIGDRQRVEIVKALYRGAKVLIMDEPTSVLTPSETRDLFAALRNLADQGMAVILITHKLEEVMAATDRVTVLRCGQAVGTISTKEANPGVLARMMIGREVSLKFAIPPRQQAQTIFEVEHLSVRNDMDLPAIHDLSFTISSGEILGVAGVLGNGQEELVEALLRIRPMQEGVVLMDGRRVDRFSTRQILDLGLACIPFDRHLCGLVMGFTVSETLALRSWNKAPFVRHHLTSPRAMVQAGKAAVQTYDIRVPSVDVPIEHLSGGNQQKVIFARELADNPRVLLACNPTRGLDLGATEFVLKQLLVERERGAAILFISTELEEILSICDRFLVLFQGKIMGEQKPSSADLDLIALWMAGAGSRKMQ